MLTILRKIRRSLIDSGRTKKYLLYAKGEIALVVTGILIALQINNWNENNNQRIEERRILLDLKEEINPAIESRIQLAQNYKSQQDTLAFALDKLFSRDALSLSGPECKAIAWTHIFDWDPYKVSTIDELVASGKINLIESKELRKKIILFRNTSLSIEQKMNRVIAEVNVLVDMYPELVIRNWNRQTQFYTFFRCDTPGMKNSRFFLAHLQSNRGRMGELIRVANAEIGLLKGIKDQITIH